MWCWFVDDVCCCAASFDIPWGDGNGICQLMMMLWMTLIKITLSCTPIYATQNEIIYRMRNIVHKLQWLIWRKNKSQTAVLQATLHRCCLLVLFQKLWNQASASQVQRLLSYFFVWWSPFNNRYCQCSHHEKWAACLFRIITCRASTTAW